MSPSPLVLITGASSGIGAALVNAYAAAGWRVAMVARREAVMHEKAKEAGLDAARYQALVCDVTDAPKMAELSRALMQDWGVPDVVIANAGISVGVMMEDPTDFAVYKDVMETNWLSTIATLSPFIAAMRARGSGRLVGIASVGGMRGLGGHGAYSASKAAVVRTLESLRVELVGTGVKVVTICPGYIATPLTSKNPFSMPFLLQPADFAGRCLRAIESGTSYKTIPWQMGIVSSVLKWLPNWLYDRAFAGRKRKPRAEKPPPAA